MRRRKLQIIVSLLAIVAAGPVAAQITSNPIPAPLRSVALRSRSWNWRACPTPAGYAPPTRT